MAETRRQTVTFPRVAEWHGDGKVFKRFQKVDIDEGVRNVITVARTKKNGEVAVYDAPDELIRIPAGSQGVTMVVVTLVFTRPEKEGANGTLDISYHLE